LHHQTICADGCSLDCAPHAPDQDVTLSFIELLTAGAAGTILLLS
jgi:hypothetical protein